MVKNKSKKRAFSLAEAIMSMLIIVIAMIGIAPIMTTKKHNAGLNTKASMGTFACYYDNNGKLRQALYIDNTEKENIKVEEINRNDNDQPHCEFTQSLQSDKLFVYATGAGSVKSSAQFVSEPFTIASGVTKIYPGIADAVTSFENHDTTWGSNKHAWGGYMYAHNDTLQPQNIQSCELVKKPDACPQECLQSNRVEEIVEKFKPTGCEFLPDDDVISITGCGCKNEQKGNNKYSLSEITKINIQNRIDPLTTKSSSKKKFEHAAQGGLYNLYETTDGKFQFNLKLKDFSYDGVQEDSQMANALSNMNPLRKNKLINEIIKLQPGAKGKSGAVVILW